MTSKPTFAIPKFAINVGQASKAGRKDANEDSYGVLIPDEGPRKVKGVVAALADGMSGGQGKLASECCIKALTFDYYGTPESWDVKRSVSEVLTSINRWLYSEGERNPTGGPVASTLTALVIKAGTGHLFHAGDSRLYRLRAGTLEPLTRDHRARGNGGRDYLARAMGQDLHLDMDYQAIAVEIGDAYLFVTDGVHEFVDHAALQRLADASDPDASAAAIVDAALEAGSDDNLTAQLIRIDGLDSDDLHSVEARSQALPFPPELRSGLILDGYKIQREIHASTRSEIFLAEDTESGDTVAIKVPSAYYDDDLRYRTQFLREEWVGGQIDHPHVLKVLPRTRPRQALYFVMEHVQGRTLRQWMTDHAKPDLEETRTLIDQMIKGVRAFHRREMIHQDLKPENIMIDRDDVVKIVDFGSVRAAGLSEIAGSDVEDDPLLGTVDYTAPERLLGAASTKQTDLYALGVMAYEMLTGHLPYGKGFKSAKDVARFEYISARKHRPNLPAWVDGALQKAVHKNPERRYQAMSEFLADLTIPNPKFADDKKGKPLIERDPMRFWRLAAVLEFFIILGLAFFLIP